MILNTSLTCCANILEVDHTPSTNASVSDYLKNHDLMSGTVFYTHRQTAGRGQGKNVWESETGKNITASIYLKPQGITTQNQFILSMAISLGVYDFLLPYIPDGLRIKWPNDLYVNDKKIAGILIECSSTKQYVNNLIAGVGININQKTFPDHVPNPVSLIQISQKEHDLSNLLPELQQAIWKQFVSINQHTTARYKQLLYRNKGYFPYQVGEKTFEAQFVDINPFGHLILETKSGKHYTYQLGEIHFLPALSMH